MQDLGRGITLEIVDMLHQVNGLGGGYPGDSGHVTQVQAFQRGHTRACGLVMLDEGSGR